MTTYDFIAANKRKSTVLIMVFMLIVIGVAWIIDYVYDAGGLLIVIAAVYASFTALFGYYRGDSVALAASGAKQVTEKELPYLVRMVDNLCISQGMPSPKIHVIQDPAINAFATGRDPEHASIAVTTGAIEQLENEELEGVIAHELSHVKNYDIRVMTLVIVLVGIITIIADVTMRISLYGGGRRKREGGGALMIIGLLAIIIAPIVAQLIKLAVSRRREYLADSSGALMTRFPEGLARALEKIDKQHQPMARASGATAHLFIANPFSGKAMANLFSTHPPIEKRVSSLRQMAGPSL